MQKRFTTVVLPDLTPHLGGLEPDEDYDGLELRNLDLSGQSAENARFLSCLIAGCVLDDVVVSQAQIADTILADVRAHTLTAIDSAWRDVAASDCRLGAITAYGAQLTRVRVSGGKLDYVNLRDATLTDVVVEDCAVGELDLGGARVTRLAFENCRVGRLVVTGARLDRVDLRGADLAELTGIAALRGATITPEQLVELAPAFAEHVGLTVAER